MASGFRSAAARAPVGSATRYPQLNSKRDLEVRRYVAGEDQSGGGKAMQRGIHAKLVLTPRKARVFVAQ